MYYIGLNQLNANLKDLKVRQAMSYALDKATIVSTVFGEYAFPTNDIFPENHWSHSTTVTAYPYDPAKAEALLQEAGYTKNASTGIYEKDGAPLHLIFDMPQGCRFAPRCNQCRESCKNGEIPLSTLPDGRQVRCVLYAE